MRTRASPSPNAAPINSKGANTPPEVPDPSENAHISDFAVTRPSSSATGASPRSSEKLPLSHRSDGRLKAGFRGRLEAFLVRGIGSGLVSRQPLPRGRKARPRSHRECLRAAIAPKGSLIAAHGHRKFKTARRLELVAQIKVPVATFLRISGGVVVVAVKHVLHSGLCLEAVPNRYGHAQIRGRKRLPVRKVERRV